MSEKNIPATDSFRDHLATVDEKGKRKWVYAHKTKGKIFNIRTWVSWGFFALFFTLPFIQYKGRPLFLFNIPEAKFIIFGYVFWPQDFFIFGLAMVTGIIFIVLFTAAFGRLFCGWVCPQTIFMEMLFRKIEFAIEGDAPAQKILNKGPWNTDKILKKISKHFKEINIVENASAEIDRGDKIALIGANGKGKSTLLRIISGAEPFNGEREWGHNVVESFYAQHQLEALHLENNLLEEMQTTRSGKTELELRSLLGAFLFSGDNVDKKIKVLSGGERARVALAKTITSKANFLMLDEPTNHLDIHSVDLLVEALNKYEGSLILVSHDRYFISRLANKIWEIDDHKIIEFKGSYAEWEDWKQRREAEQKNKKKEIETPKEVKKQPENNPPNQDQKKEVQQLKSKFKKLEEKIAKQQQETNRLEQALSNPEIYAETQKFTAAENLYKNAQKELEKLNGEYEGIFEQIMKIEEGQ